MDSAPDLVGRPVHPYSVKIKYTKGKRYKGVAVANESVYLPIFLQGKYKLVYAKLVFSWYTSQDSLKIEVLREQANKQKRSARYKKIWHQQNQ